MTYHPTVLRAIPGRVFITSILLTSLFVSINLKNVFAADVSNAPNALAAITVPVGTNPSGIVSGDFNQDGKPDFAVVHAGSFNLAIVLNEGGGNFSTPVFYGIGVAGAFAGDIKTGDFNADGILDLATATGPYNNFESYVQVRLGDGMGNFAAPLNTVGGRTPAAIAVADFNGDGRSDMATANTAGGPFCHGGYAQIFLNNGTGAMSPPTTINLRPQAYDIVAGDFNSDGKPDLAARAAGDIGCGATQGGVDILLNNGSGGFSVTNPLASNISPSMLVAADFNHDGRLDLAGPAGSGLLVIYGTGAGDFVMGSTFALGVATYEPQAADFNSDGNLDIAVVDNVTDKAFVVYGNSAGGFSSSNMTFTGNHPIDLTIADFDGNSRPDLAVPNYYANSVSIILDVNAPSLSPRTQYDFDGDLKVDFAVYRDGNTLNAPSYWHILRSSNNTYQGIQHGASGDKPVPADWNGDGTTDVAVWRPSTGVWYTSTNAASNYGAFHWGQNGDVPLPGDFDGDGKADYAVYRPSVGYWYLLKSANGAYQEQQFGTSTDKPVLGDFDGDGKTDIAFYRPGASPLADSFWHVIRSSNGQFLSTQFGRGEDKPVPADYDGDGRTNFAVFRPSDFTWYTSTNPAINYGAYQWGAEGDVPAPADFDADTRADLVIFRPGSSSWYILRSTDGGVVSRQWGAPGDKPAPSSFIP